MELKPVEDTSWLQLFIKNTALCKHEILIEAPVNGGRNYNGPKVAKFLVG
jgi:hypothetical protein